MDETSVKYSESEPCREIVTKEKLYERLNNSITRSQMSIMKESARLDLLRDTIQNLNEYFEDSECEDAKVEKTGHWINIGAWIVGDRNLPIFKCSVCDKDTLEKGNFCPNCGVKMVEKEKKNNEEV